MVSDEYLVGWLLERGADPNLGMPYYNNDFKAAPIRSSWTALAFAAQSSTPAVIDLLMSYGARIEDCCPLHEAALVHEDAERIPMMAHLLKLGVDVNAQDYLKHGSYGRGTALHWAIWHYNPEKVRFLLDNGADPHIENLFGLSPLKQVELRGSPLLHNLVTRASDRIRQKNT